MNAQLINVNVSLLASFCFVSVFVSHTSNLIVKWPGFTHESKNTSPSSVRVCVCGCKSCNSIWCVVANGKIAC